MRYRFFFTPDASPTGNDPESKNPAKKPKYPFKAADFAALNTRIAESWAAHPELTLLWIQQPEYERKASDFSDVQQHRMLAGGSRPDITNRLEQYAKQADDALSFVKGYIKDKWEDKATAQAQYARYGIRKVGNSYLLPVDQQQRLEALDLMLLGISKDGFDDKKYGRAFWDELKNNYARALEEAGSTDGTISLNVGDKTMLREALTDIMDALQLLIRANYPKTWEKMLRDWGWQREDY